MLGALRVRAGRPGPEERAYTSLCDVRLTTAVLPRTVEPTAVFSDPGRTRHSAERGNLCSGCLKTKPRQHPRASLAAVTDPLWGALTAKGAVSIFSTLEKLDPSFRPNPPWFCPARGLLGRAAPR